MKIKEFKNKKVAILWFWLEGKSSLDFLLGLWVKDITILDKNEIKISFNNIKTISWEKYLDNLDKYDLIIKSPWISPYNPKIKAHKDKLTSQTKIFLENYTWKVIWITWTKGKTTISSLTYKVLKSAWYKVKLVWNIWKPVLDEIDLCNCHSELVSESLKSNKNKIYSDLQNIKKQEKYDFIIYELSSYMLEWFSPKLFIWVLNNIFPDHMNRHDNSFEIYKKAKKNILKNALNKIDWRKLKNTKVFKTRLMWEHNQRNINVIKKIINIIGVKKDIFLKIVKDFKPISHRLENIWVYKWITFIDDAISTTPESTIEAIKTFWKNIWTIFLWWEDRWYNFLELVKYLKKYNIKNIVLFPNSWEKIFKLLDNSFNVLKTTKMKKAVSFAFKNTKKWKICLLSNASPSYNLWENYKEKAKEFKKEINLL